VYIVLKLVALVCFVFALHGLSRPERVLPWSASPTRAWALLLWLSLTVVLLAASTLLEPF
jgi:hypothetical protein